MKTFANRLALLAATAAVATTMAYGQNQMKAEIPFPFQARGMTLPAGSYTITADESHGGAAVIMIYNSGTKKTVLTLPHGATAAPNKPVRPRMTFLCTDGNCALSQVWMINAGFQYTVHPRSAREQVTSIPLRAASAE